MLYVTFSIFIYSVTLVRRGNCLRLHSGAVSPILSSGGVSQSRTRSTLWGRSGILCP